MLSVVDADMLGATDEQHRQLAFKQMRVIFTHDDDFLKLHAAGVAHAGIVYTHQNKSLGEDYP